MMKVLKVILVGVLFLGICSVANAAMNPKACDNLATLIDKACANDHGNQCNTLKSASEKGGCPVTKYFINSPDERGEIQVFYTTENFDPDIVTTEECLENFGIMGNSDIYAKLVIVKNTPQSGEIIYPYPLYYNPGPSDVGDFPPCHRDIIFGDASTFFMDIWPDYIYSYTYDNVTGTFVINWNEI